MRLVFNERGEVAMAALPEGRLSRVAGAVNLHDGTCHYIGTPPRDRKHGARSFLQKTAPTACFPTKPRWSAWSALLVEVSEDWETENLYLNMETPTQPSV